MEKIPLKDIKDVFDVIKLFGQSLIHKYNEDELIELHKICVGEMARGEHVPPEKHTYDAVWRIADMILLELQSKKTIELKNQIHSLIVEMKKNVEISLSQDATAKAMVVEAQATNAEARATTKQTIAVKRLTWVIVILTVFVAIPPVEDLIKSVMRLLCLIVGFQDNP